MLSRKYLNSRRFCFGAEKMLDKRGGVWYTVFRLVIANLFE